LKVRFALLISPGKVQHIGIDFAVYTLEPDHLIALVVGRLSIDPGSVRHDRAAFWGDGLYSVETQVSLKRKTVRGFLIFQKDSQNFDRPKPLLSCVLQLQEDPWLRVYKSKRKRLLFFDTCTHKNLFLYNFDVQPSVRQHT
jgi:hypothetical protein